MSQPPNLKCGLVIDSDEPCLAKALAGSGVFFNGPATPDYSEEWAELTAFVRARRGQRPKRLRLQFGQARRELSQSLNEFTED